MKLNLSALRERLRSHFLQYRGFYQRAGLVFLLLAILLTGIVGGYLYADRRAKEKLFQKDAYLDFLSEVYDTIKENYWEKIADEQLTELFKLGAEKITGQAQVLEKADAAGLKQMALIAMKDMSAEQKKEFVTQLANLVLVNLKPFGRSQLYTAQEETQLRETVKNIDKTTDLYQSLGVAKTASPTEIQKAYEKKVAELTPQKETSPAAAQELAQAQRAFETLSKSENKEIYDQSGVEPTVFARTLTPDIVLLKMTKLSPQTFEEFQKVTAEIDKTSRASSLILDLRGNVGGAIDLLQYFLGPFIGPGQSAYDFFHRGDYQPFKTQTGWLPSLVRYKKVVILVDNQTQSSAELMAAVLKKYNVGILVGRTTKGWGTVENTFPLKNQLDLREKYSLFLVHSLTLRDDNQPIEGRGVDPTINVAAADWAKQLFGYLHYEELVKAVEDTVKK